ncbi:AsmA family protein [Proteus mirabilis]|uniref:AsmA family protein n=1 Tax=Proteus TaxID=583 RepID=UPI0011406626|nr:MULTISPECIES: AsmA family protein [Proteus]EHZ8014382.1 AsmA family protein [Proteus mirabilis]EKU5732542.1 AsmA family protein [Proteus mirabilis]EKV2709519.1 AsmA family protein [Proteus mirabilis]EKX5059722.1 AsmA family protein [Proteus mirabilis]MBQ0521505.1 AsmA family protein [Proteus mirabilis]
MRWLIKSLVSLILIVILFIIVIYAFLQTQWGAQKTSEWLTQYSDYDIRFSGIEHDLTQPEQIVVYDLSINPKQDKTAVLAQSAQLRFNWQFFTMPSHLQKITLENGKIILANKIAPLPVSADILQFKNMQLDSMPTSSTTFTFSANKITGGITPWKPTSTDPIGAGHFQFSIADGMIGKNSFNNFIVAGEYQPNRILIEKLATQFLNGSLSLSGQYQDNQWQLNDVYLTGLRWQSTKTLEELQQSLSQSPVMTIKQLNIVDFTAEGKQWAISGLAGQFSQIAWNNSLSLTSGELNTDDIVYKNQHVTDVIAKLNQQDNLFNIDNLSLRYEKGLIKLAGQWNSETKTLNIEDATLSGILYTLPEQWLSFFAKPIEQDVKSINIKQLSLNQSILIDINPLFPFQFTGLTGQLKNLIIAKDGQWGLWQGTATLGADSGTLNGVELRRPDITLMTQQDTAIIPQFSAFVDKGIVRGSAALEQNNNQRLFSLIVNGLNVPLSLPNNMGWKLSQPTDETGQFTLKLKGNLAADAVIPTLNGTLIGKKDDQTPIDDRMQDGEIMNNLSF